ncbi:MAG TPA: TetR/AcrR family transcriptional regulator [Propionibacteriaceae bacterium]|jgi:AcrR family transcriptional regulator
MGRPREHTEETREHLLRVASGIIRRGGPETLTVRGLAAEAGVTTRAIYSLFGGLPEVIAVLCSRSADAMVRHHEAVPVTDDPISELLPLALAYRSAAQEQADLYEMLYTPTAAAGRAATEYPQEVQRTIGRVQDTIRRAILAGQLRSVNDHDLFQGLWAVVHGLTSLELRGVLGTPAECDRIWRGTITTHVKGLVSPV